MTIVSRIAFVCLAIAGSTTACSRLTDVSPPSDLVEEGRLQSHASLLAMYKDVLFQFKTAYAGVPSAGNSFVPVAGIFADEFTTATSGPMGGVDAHTIRRSEQNENTPYEYLQGARRAAELALSNILPRTDFSPRSYIGEIYALKAYVYVLLSELYCSGIPMGSFQERGPIVAPPGISRNEMLRHAIALFDSATPFADDSVRVQWLIAIGKGRAYLGLGEFANAKDAITAVPTNFSYDFQYSPNTFSGYIGSVRRYGVFFMADREGVNGLNFSSAGDPRLPLDMRVGLPLPARFSNPASPVPLADGLEARLIEAEVALLDHDVPKWASILNTLRQTGWSSPMPTLTADSTTTAINDSVRVDVMFRERAFWLFSTGRRLGDMRRLIRQYQRHQEHVFPIGAHQYLSRPPVVYGQTSNLELPASESNYNPVYSGCIDRHA